MSLESTDRSVDCLPEPRGSRLLTLISGALLGVAALLHLRRYAGINHDAVLYLGQGLLQRWPEIFGVDPFFAFGSQEKYSLFPKLLGVLFGLADPPTVFLYGTLAGLLLFAAASWYLLLALLPPGQRYMAWLGSIVLPSLYGGMSGMFGYSEQFLTPRLITEGLVLLSIGSLVRSHWVSAIAALLVAALFHPLQAVAGLLVIWSWLVIRDRRWLYLLLGVVPLLLAGWYGMPPFRGFFTQIDQEWLSSLQEFSRQLFVSMWNPADYNLLAFDLLVALYAARKFPDLFGKWMAAAIVGLAIGLASSLILVDALHLALPAALQLWRVHWLAHWFAMVALGVLFFRDASSDGWPRMMLLALAVLLAWAGIFWLWIPAFIGYWIWPRLICRIPRRAVFLLGIGFALGCVFFFINYLTTELLRFRLAHYRLDLYAIDRRLLAFPIAGTALLLSAIFLWRSLQFHLRAVATLLILMPVLVIGVIRWDSRPLLNKAFEDAVFRSDIFGFEVPEAAQVYWNADSLTGPWLVLRRASYFSPGQLAGGVFNRATLVESGERINRLRPLIEQSMWCTDRSHSSEERAGCHIDSAAMRQACAGGSGRRPDYLVLEFNQPERAIGTWEIIDPVTSAVATTFRMFSCADIDGG